MKNLGLAIAKSYGHGLTLRLLALLAKLIFLFYVVPGLIEGLYSRYLYIFTIALIIARVISLGAEEHLPTIIRNNASKAATFFPLFLISYCIAIIAIGSFLINGIELILIIGLVAQLASGWVLGGLSRSIDPTYYERLLNIPVLLFVVSCILFPPNELGNLLFIYSATSLLVQTWIAISVRPGKIASFSDFLRTTPELLAALIPGIFKTTSNILVVLNTRAAVVLPAIILAFTVDDRIAVAISIGEAAFQLGMVIVMRHYAAFCRNEKSHRFMLNTCAILFGLTFLAGLFFLFIPIPLQINKVDWPLVGWALIFNASLLAFMEARYYYWARNEGAVITNAIQVSYLALQLATVLILPSQWWLIAMSIQAAGLTIIYLAIAFFRPKTEYN